jgi:Fe-S oxidoreductase
MHYASATNARVIATSNPGCLLQMRAGAEMHHTNHQVFHVIELLDQAITT